MEWHIENARKYVKEGEEIGYVRVDADGRIWLCADVPAARPARDQKPKNKRTEKSVSSLYRLISPGLHKQIQQLTKTKLIAMERAADLAIAWGVENLEADAVALARDIKDTVESNILAIGDLHKKNGRKPPVDRPRLFSEFKLTVPLPDFQSVQTETASVQTGESALYRAPDQSPQTGKSHPPRKHKNPRTQELAGNGEMRAFSDPDSDKTSSSSSSLVTPSTTTTTTSSIDPEREQDWIMEALQGYHAHVNRGQAYRLIKVCREKLPDIDAGEICDLLIHRVGHIARKKDNPVGYIFRCVDEKVTREELEKLRASKESRKRPQSQVDVCSRCHGHGLIGAQWEFVPELIEAIAKGAKFCTCPTGDSVRALAEVSDSAAAGGGD
jgi:hypothetical protein